MKTPKYVIAPEGCAKYLTPGKGYIVEEFDALPGEDIYDCAFTSTDDMGERIYSTLRKSAHLNGGDWIIPDGEAEREPDTPAKTLRDEFAMAADISRIEFPTMKSLAEFVGVDVPDGDDFVACLNLAATASAKIRYMFADAMLAARKEK